MSRSNWLIRKSLALISQPKKNQSLQLSSVIFKALVAYFIYYVSYSELSCFLAQSMLSVDINNAQVVASSKYALERKDWFSTDRRPEK